MREGTEDTDSTQSRRDAEKDMYKTLFFSASPCLCVRSVPSRVSVSSASVSS
jgi:hypothetical protein